ncbi:Uncharacterized protein SCF082_LOCUS3958 [Durusdinium trenchii]|uniref:Transmembrane protein n=1 Tax=Durusdinium trenchii TaxID=1381693 RepID=A0ABP0HWA3_9DINO
MDASPSASPLESSSDDEPQRCAILRGHKIFYVIATVAAVLLYVVGVMPNRKAEAESPDLVRKPLALGEIEMSDTAVLSTRPPEPEEKSAFFRMLPEQLQDWYFQEKRDLKQQMHKTKVTYYKSPHHLVHTDANQFLKSQQPGESDPLPSHTPPASND